jgi:hypothetical protein
MSAFLFMFLPANISDLFLGHGPRSTRNCARKLFHEQLGLQSDPFNAEESYPQLCRSAYTILDNLMYQVHIVV